MAFKKLRMGEEEIFETVVKDVDGRKIEAWTVMKRDYPKVVKILNSKFGLGMDIKERYKSKDLDWAL